MADPVSASTGSIADISARLVLWGGREMPGMARVEYSSEFSRQAVMNQVRAALEPRGILVQELELRPNQSPSVAVADLLERLSQLSPGVVSITGFARAFSPQVPLEEALRLLNYHRDRYASFPLRQIWWMTPSFFQTAIHAMPDMNSWFSPRLALTEVVWSEAADAADAEDGATTTIQDARFQALQLVQQFRSARADGMSDLELLKTYLLPALEVLASADAQKDLRNLTTQFEGLLGQLRQADSLDLASSLDRLATIYQKQGRYTEAEPLFQRALQLREQHLGPTHPEVATALNNLALIYQDQGRYCEAEPLCQRAIAIDEQVYGPRHLEMATDLNNLALIYQDQGRYDEAEALYQRSLAIGERFHGVDHPDIATHLNNLADLYQDQGRYDEAEALYRRSLKIRQQPGVNPLELARSLNNLATLYRVQERYDEAEALYRQSLSIRRQQLGDNHPDVATSLNNLALLYEVQGRYDEAEKLYRQSIDIRRQQLGDDHPKVAFSLRNLAKLYQDQGQTEQAEALYRRSLEILERRLGNTHPDTTAVQRSLAHLQSPPEAVSHPSTSN
ncbi:MAG: tetratricopeptide repeat protein [Cyanobacteriota bacterium]